MLEQLVVVDYQEGAGGEFLANFISAHWGLPLSVDTQNNPDHLQKWFNSHSLITLDWNNKFDNYLRDFVDQCDQNHVTKIAVPYHLYKWPDHVQTFIQTIPLVRFVKINSTGHEQALFFDYERKISNRKLNSKNIKEVQFLLNGKDLQHKLWCIEKIKQGNLRLKDVRPDFKIDLTTKQLPSNDIEISYHDLFVDVESMPWAYETLCSKLDLKYDHDLLQKFIARNKKNLQDQASYINSL